MTAGRDGPPERFCKIVQSPIAESRLSTRADCGSIQMRIARLNAAQRPLRLAQARHLSRTGRGNISGAFADRTGSDSSAAARRFAGLAGTAATAPLPVRERVCALRRRERAPWPRARDVLRT